MSATADPTPAMTGQPGADSWKSTTAESSSARCTIQVPSRVMGPVVPACGIGRMKIGTPRFVNLRLASVMARSCWSGAIVQFVTEKTGRSCSVAPPAASYMARTGSTSSGSRISSWMCLPVFRRQVACMASGAMSGSTSDGCGDGQWTSISSRASTRRVNRARSASVPSRFSPVRSSSTCVAMPSLVTTSGSRPRTRSQDGSRPARRTSFGTVARQRSTRPQPNRAVSRSRSTSAPAAASRSTASGVL